MNLVRAFFPQNQDTFLQIPSLPPPVTRLAYLVSIHLKPMSLSNKNLPTYSHSKLVSWFLIKGTLGTLRRGNPPFMQIKI